MGEGVTAGNIISIVALAQNVGKLAQDQHLPALEFAKRVSSAVSHLRGCKTRPYLSCGPLQVPLPECASREVNSRSDTQEGVHAYIIPITAGRHGLRPGGDRIGHILVRWHRIFTNRPPARTIMIGPWLAYGGRTGSGLFRGW